jgi:hypothetical protein
MTESDLPQCTNQGDDAEVLSRRHLLAKGSAVLGTGLLAIAGMSGPAGAQGWPWSPWGYPVWKSTAWYRNYPNGPQMCANCRYFRPPYACAIVESPISPHGWSRFWAPRGGRYAAGEEEQGGKPVA